MEIEIELVGQSKKWTVAKSYVRIGRSTKCEVTLPAKQYPSVALEHLALEVSEGKVRVASGNGIFVNNRPAGAGAFLFPRDVLRLGVDGPELRIHFVVPSRMQAPQDHEPTRLISQDESPYQPARLDSISGRDAGKTILIPDASRAVAPPRFTASSTTTSYTQPPLPVAKAVAEDGLEIRRLEGKLKILQTLVLASLVLLAAMLVLIYQLNQQLSATRDEVHELRTQAQSAVGQFMPTLDAKLAAFSGQMEGMDAKMKAAQANMENGMDAKMKEVEEHMVARMNAEIPSMLDKYISRKVEELKH